MKYFSKTRHSLSLPVILFTSLIVSCSPSVQAIMCYRCTVLPPQYAGEKDQRCSLFDASSKFHQYCRESTFCVKHTFQYRLLNGSMVTIQERDCAPQKYVYKVYSNADRSWHNQEKIDTHIYSDGCFPGENRGSPNGPSEYCYCSSNYCNL